MSGKCARMRPPMNLWELSRNSSEVRQRRLLFLLATELALPKASTSVRADWNWMCRFETFLVLSRGSVRAVSECCP